MKTVPSLARLAGAAVLAASLLSPLRARAQQEAPPAAGAAQGSGAAPDPKPADAPASDQKPPETAPSDQKPPQAAAPAEKPPEPAGGDKPKDTGKAAKSEKDEDAPKDHGPWPEKRRQPDYDGRKDGTSFGEVALWVPRLVVSPIYLTTEYVIRRPLGTLITAAEQSNLPKALYDFFTFGPDHKAGFAPIVFFDFGFRPSVGLYVFWDDAFFKGNDIRVHGSIWFGDWLAGVLTDRITLGKESTLTFELAAIRRPDHVFYGVGPNTLEDNRSRYGRLLLDGSVSYSLGLWRSSSVQTRMGVKRATFKQGDFGTDPSIGQEVDRGTYPLPDGFTDGYTAEYHHVLAALDTRLPRPASGSGVRVEAEAEQGTQIDRAPGSAWLRYGGTAGFFYDLNGKNRVVSLNATALFADPISNDPIPFTELVQLGGYGPMRGFWPGRLLDRSAAVLTARYKWPIWAFLDGTLEAAVGNVFGTRLEGFDAKLLRFSGALGISTVGSPDSSLEVLFGVGTETFDSGGKIDSFRLLVGTNRGF